MEKGGDMVTGVEEGAGWGMKGMESGVEGWREVANDREESMREQGVEGGVQREEEREKQEECIVP